VITPINVTIDVPLHNYNVACPLKVSGLACRDDFGYQLFVSDFPNAKWMFRAVDDTWISLLNLRRYLLKLERRFNPDIHIVFKTHANRQFPGYPYAHGGGGWLVSRAYAKYHMASSHIWSLVKLIPFAKLNQDDTAQSIAVRHIFSSWKDWDEPLINGFDCLRCDYRVASRNWDKFDMCPENVILARLSDLVAMHTRGHRRRHVNLISTVEKAPPYVFYYRRNENLEFVLCVNREQKVSKVETSLGSFVTAELLPDPLIDFATLVNENMVKM
jgi:hypothetical protein